jgi:hypothetical protein
MVTLNINIRSKDLYLVGAIFIFLIGTGVVIAIGSNNYQVQGHDFSELQKCTAGKVLKSDSSGNWVCGDDTGGGGTLSVGTFAVPGTGNEGGPQYKYIGKGNCFAFVKDFNQVSNGYVHCDYDPSTGRVSAWTYAGGASLTCGYVCLS